MTEPRLDWDTIGRYLAGESSPPQVAAVRRWLADHPGDARLLSELDAAIKARPAESSVDVEAALRHVKARIHARARTPWRYAAVLVAAAAVILVLLLPEPWTPGPRRQVVSMPHVYTTAIGMRDSVLLDEGTRIVLGPATRLAVRASSRDVELNGEAYFIVTHDERRPFTVRAGSAIVRDVGTRFSIHNHSSADVRVIVNEGSVQLIHAADSVLLRQGDVGVLSSSGLQASRGAATPDDIAWTQGRLVFRNATVPQLAADLRRWYGVQLRVIDTALGHRHFTGTFVGESADRVLDVIALAIGARFERQGDTAIFRAAAPGK